MCGGSYGRGKEIRIGTGLSIGKRCLARVIRVLK
jgi:hypothetical protein